jgi:hypothetical protein
MKKLATKIILAGVLGAFAATSFNAAYACDGMKGHNKGGEQAKKDSQKKSDEAARNDQKTDQKTDQKS